MNLTEEQLIEIYHIIFSDIHSRGFMTSEVKDLLFQPDYWFLQPPKNIGWYNDVIKYLDGVGYDKSNLHINPAFIQ